MSPLPAEIVHPIPSEELRGWFRSMVGTFLDDPDGEEAVRGTETVAREWKPERNWGVRDRGRWVATLTSEARTVTVPGRDDGTEVLAVDAITHVTVAATHRRRGLLRAMMRDALLQARERGDAMSILIAAEYPIYGRYGYAPATDACWYTLYPRRRGGQVAGEPGRVRQVERDEFIALAPGVYERCRRRRAGHVDRDGSWWPRSFGGDGWPEPRKPLLHNWLVHDGDDGPDGLLGWLAIRQEASHQTYATVDAFGPYAATDAAERDLWAYLSGLDLVDAIRLDQRPPDEAARWLLADARHALVLTKREDHLWLKLLDVPAALAARGYCAPGELVLDVTDDSAVSAAGRYRLSVAPDGAATCEPTTAAPDLTLSQTVLASAYLGGNSIAQQVIAGGLTEHTHGSARRADAMFMTPLAPWNATEF
jgi:predicted acetyltransferase